MSSLGRPTAGSDFRTTASKRENVAAFNPTPSASTRIAEAANRGFLRNERSAYRTSWSGPEAVMHPPIVRGEFRSSPSLLPQADEGIDARRAARREEAGSERDGQHHEGSGEKGERVGGGDLEQESPQRAPEGPRAEGPATEAEGGQACRLAADQRED